MSSFIDEIVEYDSVVNQFFLPMMKQKIENPRDDIQKEINEQNDKLSRIKKAYIMEFAKELYEHGALDDEDFNLLQDSKNTNNINKFVIEKDDIER